MRGTLSVTTRQEGKRSRIDDLPSPSTTSRGGGRSSICRTKFLGRRISLPVKRFCLIHSQGGNISCTWMLFCLSHPRGRIGCRFVTLSSPSSMSAVRNQTWKDQSRSLHMSEFFRAMPLAPPHYVCAAAMPSAQTHAPHAMREYASLPHWRQKVVFVRILFKVRNKKKLNCFWPWFWVRAVACLR